MLVVKVGGSKGIDLRNVAKDVVNYENIILLHGGSHELNKLQEKLDHPPKTLTSVSGYTSRYTDEKTMEMFQMIYSGKVNKQFVCMLQENGVNALGLSGVDGRLVTAKRKEALKVIENDKKKIIRDDLSGIIKDVNTDLINTLLSDGFVPVITPPVIGEEFNSLNVDGDRMAAEIAKSLGAETLLILSNVPGLLRDIDDENSLIENISKDEIEDYMQYAEGRMKKKLLGAKEALEEDVNRVIFASANKENPITSALQGNGTVIE